MMRSVSRLSALVLSLVVPPAATRAGLVFTAVDVTTAPNATGSLLVTLQNTGPAAVDLSAYQVTLTTSVAGMRFTGVGLPTSPPYLFPGAGGPTSSDFGPPFPPPVTTFTATDFSAGSGGFDTLGAGQTRGVLLADFAMAGSAPLGHGLVSFVSPGTGATDLTQLADRSGNLLGFTAVNANVTVVPEPGSLTLILIGAAALVLGKRYKQAAVRRTP
jgi:hypothetical protein